VKTNGGTHLTINRGKRSITLDLKLEADADILRSLIKTADVFIHNVRDKAINKLGFAYEAVKAIKGDIIYVHCAGFGQNGPYRDFQAYDDVIQAASGACTLSSRVDGNPQPRYIPSLIADKISGLFGTQAVLTALVHKLRTGEGQRVEVPMFEAFTSFMLEEHLCNATFVPPLGPIGYARQLEPHRQPFETADGYISIVPYTDDKLTALFGLMDAPAWLEEAGFDTPLARFKNMDEIYRKIGSLTKSRTNQAWMDIFQKAQFPAMPVRDLEDIFEDPHLHATGFFKTRDHPTEGQFREMQPPIRYSAAPDRVLGFAPSLGEHNEEIREELKNGRGELI
jgi:crotonobetainyl-CoA:carnitine CoA-transferase CaiB-like acyl-CoA transferase